jgi:hypothetical protein
MNRFRAAIVSNLIIALGISSFFITACSRESNEGTIIITRTSEGDSQKSVLRSEIVVVEQGKPEASPKVLTSSFYSARSPKISDDGQFMIFAGQKKEGDTWQIWETDLGNLKTRQLTKHLENCSDPAYLPLGRFIFACHSATDSLKTNSSIFTSNLNGTDQKQITYNPYIYLASNVLSDGRILAIGVRKFPETGDQKFMVMRPDGTKSELFYKGTEGSLIKGPGFETINGRIIFIESDKDNTGKGNLISISYNNPMHSRINLTSEIDGDFRAVFPKPSGKLLVSYRKSKSDRYALYEFDPENKSLSQPIYSSNELDVLEVADAVKHIRPRKLPSEVNAVIKTGLIMCQDVNVEDDQIKIAGTLLKNISKVEIMGIDSSLGVFNPAEDGSFYLKVIADKPFQIRTLDENGKVVRKCDWIWLRPNERRGCVGCHEDQDIVPDNRIPLAVKKAPIGIPVHVNKIKDKMIDTE